MMCVSDLKPALSKGGVDVIGNHLPRRIDFPMASHSQPDLKSLEI